MIEVRDVATGRLRLSRVLGAGDTAAFSPDGTQLAVVGGQGAVHLLNLSTGARHTATQPDHDGTVRRMAFTPDGRTLAVVDIEADGDQFRLLDAATGRTQRTIKLSAQFLSAFTFSPDGRTLATVSGSRGSVTTWDVRTGRLQDSFRVEGEVASLAFSPDARTLAASGPRGVQLWDLAISQNRLTLPTRSPEAVAFSPDGRTLAISTDGSVGLWSVDLPDPARAIHDICAAVDTTLTLRSSPATRTISPRKPAVDGPRHRRSQSAHVPTRSSAHTVLYAPSGRTSQQSYAETRSRSPDRAVRRSQPTRRRRA